MLCDYLIRDGRGKSRGGEKKIRQLRKKTSGLPKMKTIIGKDISGFLKGMMVANERYHDIFNASGKRDG